MKNCSNKKCLQNNPQPFNNFRKKQKASDGLASNCKSCCTITEKRWRLENSAHVKAVSAVNYQNNKEKILIGVKKYSIKNKKKIAISNHNSYLKNKNKILDANRKWAKANPEKMRGYQATYYQKNKKSLLLKNKKHKKKNIVKNRIKKKNRLESDFDFKLKELLSCRVRNAIKNQSGEKSFKTKDLIGCSVKVVTAHLFDNYYNKTGIRATVKDISVHGLHIDHITPCDYFDLTDPEQQKLCFHYTNLQLLPAKENLKKKNKLDYKS